MRDSYSVWQSELIRAFNQQEWDRVAQIAVKLEHLKTKIRILEEGDLYHATSRAI